MTTYRYSRITARRSFSGKCPVCGRRVTRTRTFEQTVNPFHPAIRALPPGSPNDLAVAAVRQSVEAEADKWVPDFTHERCAS